MTSRKNPVCVHVYIRITYTRPMAPAPPPNENAKPLIFLEFLLKVELTQSKDVHKMLEIQC